MIDIRNKQNLVEFLLKKNWGGFISMHNLHLTDEDNDFAFKDLQNKIVNSNIGLRRLNLHFEINNVKQVKKILLLNGIELKKLIKLGIEHDRNSVVYFDDLLFLEISTNKEIGIGKILTDFNQVKWNSENFDVRNFLLKLIIESFEGLKCDKKLSNFNLIYSYFERYSFNEVAYLGKKPGSVEKQIILFEE